MKKLVKSIRFILFIILILLASLGVGLTGVAPPQPKNNKFAIETRQEADESKKKKQIRKNIHDSNATR